MSSIVRFHVTQRTADGTRVPIADGGRVVLEPTRLIVVEGDPDEMVIPARIAATLVDGRVDMVMDATGPSWCWRIFVQDAQRNTLHEGYYAVPESASPLDYPADLVEVDQMTLVPAESAVPAWDAVVSTVEGYAVQAAGSAVTVAAHSAAAQSAADEAAESASMATTNAAAATVAAQDAALSAATAGLARVHVDPSPDYPGGHVARITYPAHLSPRAHVLRLPIGV